MFPALCKAAIRNYFYRNDLPAPAPLPNELSWAGNRNPVEIRTSVPLSFKCISRIERILTGSPWSCSPSGLKMHLTGRSGMRNSPLCRFFPFGTPVPQTVPEPMCSPNLFRFSLYRDFAGVLIAGRWQVSLMSWSMSARLMQGTGKAGWGGGNAEVGMAGITSYREIRNQNPARLFCQNREVACPPDPESVWRVCDFGNQTVPLQPLLFADSLWDGFLYANFSLLCIASYGLWVGKIHEFLLKSTILWKNSVFIENITIKPGNLQIRLIPPVSKMNFFRLPESDLTKNYIFENFLE